MSNSTPFPLYKVNVTIPLYYVDNLEHSTEEELDEKVATMLQTLMENEPHNLIKWASYEFEEDGFELSEEDMDEKVRFSAEYINFLRSMIDAGLMPPIKEGDE